jgi:hypothetical protein
MWLDAPVISRDGDTLNIVRGKHWGLDNSAECLFWVIWLAFWSAAELHMGRSVLFDIPDPQKGPPEPFE